MYQKVCIILLLSLSPIQLLSQGLFENLSFGEKETVTSNSALQMNGYIRSVLYVSKNPYNGTVYLQSLYAEPSLLLNIGYGKTGSAYAELRFRSGNEWESTVNELNIREAYTNYSIGKFDIRLGKQLINWGNTTLINSNGRFSPIDPTVRSPENNDIKKAVWAIDMEFHPFSFMGISAVWQPIYTPTTLMSGLVPMPGMVTFEEYRFENTHIKSSSYGIKAKINTSAIDFSLNWFNGNNHWPGIDLITLDINQETFLPEAIVIQERSYRIQSLGANFVLPIKSWLFRGEMSLMKPHVKEKSIYTPLSEICYTAEFERTYGEFTLIAGYYGKWIPNFTEPTAKPQFLTEEEYAGILAVYGDYITPELVASMVSEQMSAFNRLYNYQMNKADNQAYIVPNIGLFHEVLTIEAPIIYNFSTEELLAKVVIKYSPSDGMTFSAGFDYMGGSKNSLYDMVGPYLNGPWISLRYGF